MTIPLDEKCDGKNDCPKDKHRFYDGKGEKSKDEAPEYCKPEGESESYFTESGLFLDEKSHPYPLIAFVVISLVVIDK